MLWHPPIKTNAPRIFFKDWSKNHHDLPLSFQRSGEQHFGKSNAFFLKKQTPSNQSKSHPPKKSLSEIPPVFQRRNPTFVGHFAKTWNKALRRSYNLVACPSPWNRLVSSSISNHSPATKSGIISIRNTPTPTHWFSRDILVFRGIVTSWLLKVWNFSQVTRTLLIPMEACGSIL